METYLSNVAFVMPRTKKEAEKLAVQIVGELEVTPQNIVEFLAKLKHFDTLVELIKKDNRIIKAFTEAIENNEIENTAAGCVVKVFDKASYDFSENEKWTELKEKEKALKTELSKIEKTLKAELKDGFAGMRVSEDGEVQGKAKIKKFTRYFKTDYEKDNK